MARAKRKYEREKSLPACPSVGGKNRRPNIIFCGYRKWEAIRATERRSQVTGSTEKYKSIWATISARSEPRCCYWWPFQSGIMRPYCKQKGKPPKVKRDNYMRNIKETRQNVLKCMLSRHVAVVEGPTEGRTNVPVRTLGRVRHTSCMSHSTRSTHRRIIDEPYY